MVSAAPAGGRKPTDPKVGYLTVDISPDRRSADEPSHGVVAQWRSGVRPRVPFAPFVAGASPCNPSSSACTSAAR